MEQPQTPGLSRPHGAAVSPRPLAGVVLAAVLGLGVWLLVEQALRFQWRRILATDFSPPWQGPWRFPTESLLALAAAGAVWLAIFGIGWLLMQAFGGRRTGLDRAERLALAPLVGAVPFSLAVLLAGMAGLGSPLAMQLLLLVAMLIGLAGWGGILRSRPQRRDMRPNPLIAALVAPVAPVLLVSLLYALAPETQSDALRYHVAAPAQWLLAGRIHYLPFQAFSNFPFLGEMLFMPAMAFAGPAAAGAVHWGMLPLSMALVALLARRWLRASGRPTNRGHAAAAGAALALLPSMPILAGWGFIDFFMMAYVMGFVLVAAAVLRRAGARRGLLVGLLGAGGVGVKYSLLPLLGAYGASWVVLLAWRAGPARALRMGLLATAMTALFACPWFIRNAVWTGNPVYPLAIGLFGGGEWSAADQAFYLDKAAEKGWRLEGWPRPLAAPLELALTPLTTAFRPDRFEDHLTGPLPLLALLAGVGWLLVRRRGHTRKPGTYHAQVWFMIALVGSWVYWFATYQSIRLILPTLGLLFAAGGVALAGWEASLGRVARWTLRPLALAGSLLALAVWLALMLVPGAGHAPALATALGFQRPELHLARTVSYWPAAQWLSAQSLPGEATLLVGEYRTLYFDLPVLASDWFDPPQPLPLIRQTADNDQLLDRLLAAGVRTIFYHHGELALYHDDYFRQRFTPAEYARFAALLPVGPGSRPHPRLTPLPHPGAGRDGITIYRILEQR